MSLRDKTIKGVLWSAVEKLSVKMGQVLVTIVLARLLLPSDFGLIGMLSIFIVLSQTLLESGMSSGLIQKKDRTDIDISTVFVFNLCVSILLYGILFLLAPVISDFYDMPQLTGLSRVLLLNILISSLTIVQRTMLQINVDFKTLARINIIAIFVSGCISIVFAYLGFGVWALVIQNLLKCAIESILLWTKGSWRLSLKFSVRSFKTLFTFGYKILLSSLYSKSLYEIYNITIGKTYSATELGLFTKAKQFSDILASTVTSIVDQVTFPVMASIQDNKERLGSILIKLVGITSYFVMPALILLAVIADPFVKFVLTESWYPVIPLLQLMCFARLFYPISIINLNVLKSIGRSDLFLKVNLWKMPLIIGALIITIPLGLKAVAIGQVVTSTLGFVINTYYSGKFFQKGLFNQLKAIMPICFSSLIMAICVFYVVRFFDSNLLKLIVGGVSGFISYFIFSVIFKVKEFYEIKHIVKERFSKI